MITKILLFLVILANGCEHEEKSSIIEQVFKNCRKEITTAYEQLQNIGHVAASKNEKREQILKGVIVDLERLSQNDERKRAIDYLTKDLIEYSRKHNLLLTKNETVRKRKIHCGNTEEEELVLLKNLPHKRPPKLTKLIKAGVAVKRGFLYLKLKFGQAIMIVKGARRMYKHRPSLYQIVDSPETVLPSWIITYKVFTFDWVVRWALLLFFVNNYELFPGRAAFAIQVEFVVMFTIAEFTWRIMLIIPLMELLHPVFQYFANIRLEPLGGDEKIKTEMKLMVMLSTVAWFLSFYIIFYQIFYHLLFPEVIRLVCGAYYSPSALNFFLPKDSRCSQYCLLFLWSLATFGNLKAN